MFQGELLFFAGAVDVGELRVQRVGADLQVELGLVEPVEIARDLGEMGDVPIIFLTAYADDTTVARAAEVSPYGYLQKPFDDGTLAATVKVAPLTAGYCTLVGSAISSSVANEGAASSSAHFS